MESPYAVWTVQMLQITTVKLYIAVGVYIISHVCLASRVASSQKFLSEGGRGGGGGRQG